MQLRIQTGLVNVVVKPVSMISAHGGFTRRYRSTRPMPLPANLTSTRIYAGEILTVTAAKNISKVDWVRNGVTVSSVTATGMAISKASLRQQGFMYILLA